MADKSFGVDQLDILGTGTPTISAPNQLNLECNTVAISTSVTVGQNLTVSANAGIASLNVTGIATVVNFNATGISTIASPSDTNSHSRWKVSNNGSSAYRFTGPGQDGSEDNPNVYLVRGQRYIFDVNASGHPFQLRVANGGAAYSDGVTNNGAQSGQVIFNVQHDAPAQLYYQCTNHGSMVGNIYIVGGPQVISGVLTATSFSGSGANLTSLPAQATIANNADNRVITGGSGVNLNGEANLTFDGSKLTVSSTLPEIFLTDTNTSNARGRLNANGGGLLLGADNDNAAANSVISFAVDGSEKSRIDSSGRLLLGTTTEGEASADNLTIADSGNSGISIRSGTSSWGSIFFSDATSGTGELSGAIEYKHNDNYLRFRTNAVERLRITSAGKVGINATSPVGNLQVMDTSSNIPLIRIETSDGGNKRLDLKVESSDGVISCEQSAQELHLKSTSNTTFSTNSSERLRIASDGFVGVNVTSPQRLLHLLGNDGTTGGSSGNSDTQLLIENAGTNGAMIELMSANNGAGRIFFSDSDQSNQGGIEYLHNGDHFQVSAATSTQGVMALHLRKNNASNNVQSDMIAFDVGASGRGKIVSAPNGSSSPQFSAYSDRRLKTNFRDYTGGYDRIKSIPVKLYDEVLNDQTKSVFGDNIKTDVIGWIADEVQSVFPEAVRGTKDEVDTDGKPVYQNLSEGVFLPDAIQAIQKLIQKVETLEAKVAALEGS